MTAPKSGHPVKSRYKDQLVEVSFDLMREWMREHYPLTHHASQKLVLMDRWEITGQDKDILSLHCTTVRHGHKYFSIKVTEHHA